MAEWKIKGAAEDVEQKSAQEQEQAVLDKAVEEGKIEPEAAGKQVDEVPKINLDELNKGNDAAQKQEVEEASIENVSQDGATAAETEVEKLEEQDSPLELIKDEEKAVETSQPNVDERAAQVNEKPKPAEPEVVLPENVNKLVKFMEETGGSVEDFVLLNRDLSKYNDGDLLREYYNQSKPWDTQEVSEYMEDNFSYDEEQDDPRDIRSKKRAFKEELFNAKRFLEGNKEKYYAKLKLNKQTDIPQEYQEALKYYNTYQESAESSKQLTESFLQKTDSVFNQDFKGFDFQVGDNKYRYKINNVTDTKTQQSDINNFVKPFLGDDGAINDAAGYHKALFTARNADKLAEHFYEQGRADALRKSAKDAKNINMDPRQEGIIKTASGQKFKVVSGDSSSKLRMKLRK